MRVLALFLGFDRPAERRAPRSFQPEIHRGHLWRGGAENRDDDIVFSAAKLFFAYGLGNAMTFPLSVGATAVLFAGRPTPDAVFEILDR